MGAFRRSLVWALSLVLLAVLPALAGAAERGSPDDPLRVMLIPADGGAAAGTRADFEPLFNAVTRATGLHFNMRVGSSYAAVVEAMAADQVDIAWFGPISYVQARRRGAAELLAVSVLNGRSVYHAGIFVPADSPIQRIGELRGKRVAFGDINSTSSFTYQVAMMLEAGLDPARDLAEVRLTGSHAGSIKALTEGLVDAACASFISYSRAVNRGVIDPDGYRVLAKSDPIPNPPIAMNTGLPEPLKRTLKDAFHTVHQAEGVTPEMIRGYGGRRVDRYNAQFSESRFDAPAGMLGLVDDQIKAAMLAAAGRR